LKSISPRLGRKPPRSRLDHRVRPPLQPLPSAHLIRSLPPLPPSQPVRPHVRYTRRTHRSTSHPANSTDRSAQYPWRTRPARQTWHVPSARRNGSWPPSQRCLPRPPTTAARVWSDDTLAGALRRASLRSVRPTQPQVRLSSLTIRKSGWKARPTTIPVRTASARSSPCVR